MSYRNKKLLQSAKGQSCMLCGVNNGTTVAAHANSHKFGKGISCKADDCFVAFLCQHCHDIVDGRSGVLNKLERQDLWLTAWIKTVKLWFEQNIIVMK